MGEYSVKEMKFHEPCVKWIYAGNYYTLLLVVRGTAHLKCREERYVCGSDEIFLLPQGNYASIEFSGGKYPLEVLCVRIQESLLCGLSDETTDLRGSFEKIWEEQRIVRADNEIYMLIKNLARRMSGIADEENEPGNSLFEEGILKMFWVLILRVCIADKQHAVRGKRKQLLMDEVFRYIHIHITEEITLEQMEQAFYMSRYHIAREFKKQTGQTVHAYIVKTKLDICCRYIAEGYPICEVYKLGGFGGYNHFFRAFKKQYNMTPKEYFHARNEE